METTPLKIQAIKVEKRNKPSNYPEPFASRMEGREKRALGDYFGIKKFGVNLTILAPGAVSALLHVHSKQEEFIYILKGHPSLVTDKGEVLLGPGDCSGFPAGGLAHKLMNNTDEEVHYLEIGDREKGDKLTYPEDDLVGKMGTDGKWVFTHKDGTLY